MCSTVAVVVRVRYYRNVELYGKASSNLVGEARCATAARLACIMYRMVCMPHTALEPLACPELVRRCGAAAISKWIAAARHVLYSFRSYSAALRSKPSRKQGFSSAAGLDKDKIPCGASRRKSAALSGRRGGS